MSAPFDCTYGVRSDQPPEKVTEAMFRLERDLDIPLIATNDSHYIEDCDARSHEVLQARHRT